MKKETFVSSAACQIAATFPPNMAVRRAVRLMHLPQIYTATFHAGTLLFCRARAHIASPRKPFDFFYCCGGGRANGFSIGADAQAQKSVTSIAGVTQTHSLPNFSFYLCDTSTQHFFGVPLGSLLGISSRHPALAETRRRRFLTCVCFLPWCALCVQKQFYFLFKSVKRTVMSLSLSLSSSPLSLMFACKHVPICLFLCISRAVDAQCTMKKSLIGKHTRVCVCRAFLQHLL